MSIVTIQELNDASVDAQALEDIVNGPDTSIVTTRLGRQIKTVANAIKSIPSYKGAWSNSVNYSVGDIVSIGGQGYVAVGANINSQPPSGNWALISAKGDTGPQGPAGGAINVDTQNTWTAQQIFQAGLSGASGTITGDLGINGLTIVDAGNANDGSLVHALRFGSAVAGQGIGGKRTAGGNQYGLDFYTNSLNRLSISNAGIIDAKNNPIINCPTTFLASAVIGFNGVINIQKGCVTLTMGTHNTGYYQINVPGLTAATGNAIATIYGNMATVLLCVGCIDGSVIVRTADKDNIAINASFSLVVLSL